MSFLSIAGSGAAKTMIAVTVSLHPGAAHHGSHHVTVRSGDTLSSISQREFGNATSWPALWWANRHSVHNPSMIQVGERLQVPNSHKVKPWLTRAALTAIPAPAPAPRPRPRAAPRPRGGARGGPRRALGHGHQRRARAGHELRRCPGQLPELRDPA